MDAKEIKRRRRRNAALSKKFDVDSFTIGNCIKCGEGAENYWGNEGRYDYGEDGDVTQQAYCRKCDKKYAFVFKFVRAYEVQD